MRGASTSRPPEAKTHVGEDSITGCGPTELRALYRAGPGDVEVGATLLCSRETNTLFATSRVLLPNPKAGDEMCALLACGPSIDRRCPLASSDGESMAC